MLRVFPSKTRSGEQGMEAAHKVKASSESHRRTEASRFRPDFWLVRAFENMVTNWTYLASFGSTASYEPKRFRGSDIDAVVQDMHVVLGDFTLACRKSMEGDGHTPESGDR